MHQRHGKSHQGRAAGTEGTQSEERVRPFIVFSSHALCLLFSRGAFGREDSEAGDGVSRMLHAHEVECEGSLTLEGKERNPGVSSVSSTLAAVEYGKIGRYLFFMNKLA